MKKIKKTLCKLLIISQLGLAASCYKEIESGTIVNKIYEPAKVYEVPVGEVGDIPRFPIYKPVTKQEGYVIVFETHNGKEKKRKVYVTKETYGSLEIGDYFDTKQYEYDNWGSSNIRTNKK